MSEKVSFLIKYRGLLIGAWAAVTLLGMYLFFFHRAASQEALHNMMSASLFSAAFLYLLLFTARGLILVPAAPLILVGIALFPPWPLYLLTLGGALISSAVIYIFPEYLRLDQVFGERSAKVTALVEKGLHRGGVLAIALWTFIPLTPTVLIIYACGVLHVGFRTCMLGVAIGCGANYAIYIFLGAYLLRLTGFK